MKLSSLKYARLTGLGATCLALLTSGLDAKPDKGGQGQGKGKGGSSAQGQGNPGKGNANKGGGNGNANKGGGNGKSDFKGADKVADKVQKQIEKEDKQLGKIDKEMDKADRKFAKEDAKWRENRFREDDRDSVIRYFSGFRDEERGLPPGLAKNLDRGKPLPPGWQKKVAAGYIIEDDYREWFHPVSYDTFPALERVPDTRLYHYGDRIVRVYEPRREVIDVIVVPTIRP